MTEGHERGCREGKGQQVGGIGPETCELSAHLLLELPEGAGFDVDLPLKMGAHIPFHLIYLPEGEHAWLTMDQDLFE